MTAAAVLCALATAVNPYGLRYPLQLLDTALGRTARPDIAWNNAFQPDARGGWPVFPFAGVSGRMALAVVAACALRRRREQQSQNHACILETRSHHPGDLTSF